MVSIGANFPEIFSIISYGLLYSQAIIFNKLINRQRLMQRPNYLPAMAYLLITSFFPEWNILSAALIINSLLLWVWARMGSLYNNQNPKSGLYNMGMVVGLCTFLYFPSLAFALLIIFSLVVMRPFRIDEWIIALLGIITPYYFLLAWLFLTDKLSGYNIQRFAVGYPYFHKNYWVIVAVCISFFAFLIGVYFVQNNFRKQLVQVRKIWSLLFLYLIVSLFIPFINATHTFEYWVLSAIPLSAFIGSAFFYPSRRWVPALLHWIMIGLVIVICYVVK